MGSYSRDSEPARRQRIRNFPTGRERMGMDFDSLPAFSRIPAPLVLSRILSALLRWRPLCAQRGVLADRRRFAAPIISQLVPAQLLVSLCGISLCGGLT